MALLVNLLEHAEEVDHIHVLALVHHQLHHNRDVFPLSWDLSDVCLGADFLNTSIRLWLLLLVNLIKGTPMIAGCAS